MKEINSRLEKIQPKVQSTDNHGSSFNSTEMKSGSHRQKRSSPKAKNVPRETFPSAGQLFFWISDEISSYGHSYSPISLHSSIYICVVEYEQTKNKCTIVSSFWPQHRQFVCVCRPIICLNEFLEICYEGPSSTILLPLSCYHSSNHFSCKWINCPTLVDICYLMSDDLLILNAFCICKKSLLFPLSYFYRRYFDLYNTSYWYILFENISIIFSSYHICRRKWCYWKTHRPN